MQLKAKSGRYSAKGKKKESVDLNRDTMKEENVGIEDHLPEDVQEQAQGTASAQAVLMLQKLLPNARVVYVSATGASEPEHLLYATRLGLWGTGTSFADAEEFAREIKEGGPSAMELLAMQVEILKSQLCSDSLHERY
jgi:hypothetical protein